MKLLQLSIMLKDLSVLKQEHPDSFPTDSVGLFHHAHDVATVQLATINTLQCVSKISETNAEGVVLYFALDSYNDGFLATDIKVRDLLLYGDMAKLLYDIEASVVDITL